jgi:pimeloyl-ACP methyl ester carboxylesterase
MNDYITVRDCRFFYRRAGSGIPLVLIHGHNRDGEDFAAAFENLSRDHDVVVPDLRFLGSSERRGLGHVVGIPDLAQDVHAIVEALGLERPALLGHSLGGMIVADYWRHASGPAQARALIFEDSMPYFAAGLQVLGDLFAATVDPALRERIMAKSEAYANSGCVPESVWDSIMAFDARPWLPTVNVPALAMLGDRGRNSPQAMQDAARAIGLLHIPGVCVEVFADCGHFVGLEQPERYCALVREFLASLPR